MHTPFCLTYLHANPSGTDILSVSLVVMNVLMSCPSQNRPLLKSRRYYLSTKVKAVLHIFLYALRTYLSPNFLCVFLSPTNWPTRPTPQIEPAFYTLLHFLLNKHSIKFLKTNVNAGSWVCTRPPPYHAVPRPVW